MRRYCRLLAPLIAMLAAAPLVRAADADDAGREFFEKKIRPLLVEHCYECHSAEAQKLGGGLRLDHRDGWLAGGDSGQAIEPGKPEESLLIQAVRYADDAVQMPPKGKLPAAAIADLEAWVKLGAPDPRIKAPAVKAATSWEETLRVRRDWWSLHPVVEPPLPQPKRADDSENVDAASCRMPRKRQGCRFYSENPVDRFILARLETEGLDPAEPAPPETLARRLSLVLTGLPLAPQRVAAFAEQIKSLGADAATERLVDELLASPHFGERWARHWLDVVRFTETHGNEWNYEVHHAWRYRDYLIRAFNADVPYDQFVREHIAGDLLPAPRRNEADGIDESVIGTAFYRFGEVNHDDCIGLREIGFDLADNQIDTLTKAFQATTVACARCHDHKLDAVSMQDYYALLGIVRSSRMVSHTIDAPDANAAELAQLRQIKRELRPELAAVWTADAQQVGRYLAAARAKRANHPYAEQLAAGLDAARLEKWIAALAVEKAPLEDSFEPYRRLAAAGEDPAAFQAAWQKLAAEYAEQDRQRAEFNQTQFTAYADFRGGATDTRPVEWQVGGQGLRDGAVRSGDFVVAPEGDPLIKTVLPAGCFTHAASDKLNGTLRSPVLPPGKSHISFQVMGQRSSALRLVSNNCQLNYKNYRALTSDALQWITFSPPPDRESLRTYAELMTMFDNPKFPDQLSALGGDAANYKLPWEKAAENPRSYFGVTRAVLHEGPEPPRAELSHLRRLFADPPPANLAEVESRYAAAVGQVVQAFGENKAADDDVQWLNALVRRELLSNKTSASPKLESLAQRYRQIEAGLALPRIAPGVADGGAGYDQPVFARGDCNRPGEPAPRRFLEVLSTSPNPVKPFEAAGSGRLELAERIASPANPLTARVMVNRIWHHLFGAGLVRTVDDFGHVGELPSHPELLDYLAARFAADGWSVKRLIRTIVLSRTFRASNQPSAAAKDRDPQNRLLSHYSARRIEAEAIRDSILAASGRLDLALYGMSVQPYREQENADRRLFPGPLDGAGRRSIYIKNTLMEAPKFLGVFNFPGGKVAQGRRDVTNVPAQALALLNDPFVVQQADVWAGRLIECPDAAPGERIDAMFRTALGRSPTAEERGRFEQAARQLAELRQTPDADVLKSRGIWKDLAHAIFNLTEFIYIP
ncbi:MAG TPA: PSD1 and planctomycete cytochrome C domain-containing protein [Pirellulales bacterium]|nr:PSD1 and planctomycete cytochrome C domain-containing protein [Pirellulales bacterium]